MHTESNRLFQPCGWSLKMDGSGYTRESRIYLGKIVVVYPNDGPSSPEQSFRAYCSLLLSIS